jgi:hypothetical protein
MMTLPENINNLEKLKFCDDGYGNVAVRTIANITIGTVNTSGKITAVNIDNTTWTPIPTTPLSGRKSICIQNLSGQNIKIQYDPLTIGYVGILIPDTMQRMYDIGANIILYAKSETGSAVIITEELS